MFGSLVFGPIAALEAAVRKAKVSVAVAGVKEFSHQVSSFCMRVSADGELPNRVTLIPGRRLFSMNSKASSVACTAICCLLQTHQANRWACKVHLHQVCLTRRQ